jgi:hypothetical protein
MPDPVIGVRYEGDRVWIDVCDGDGVHTALAPPELDPRHLDAARARIVAEETARDALNVELGNARARVAELEAVIREYVAEVENGARFDALVSAVPGLESDDGGTWRSDQPITERDDTDNALTRRKNARA